MSQRTIERLIGRLLTDEELRHEFSRAPRRTLAVLTEQGWELSRFEVDALLAIDVDLWSEVAARIDPRLKRCSLKSDDDRTVRS
jgi:hypothetical protein